MSNGEPRIGTLPYLSRSLLTQLKISTIDLANELERQIVGQRHGSVWCAPKAAIWPGDDRFVMTTLGISTDPNIVASKTLVVNPRNAERGLAAINALVTLLDGDTGLPLAVIDGNWVTEKRTAALTIVAAKRLANADSSVAAFIGCGTQARGHLEALGEHFPLREIRAFGRGNLNRDALCAQAREHGLRSIPCASAQDAVDGADIVITSLPLVPEPERFLDARWLKPGCFASMVDLALPWISEPLSCFDCIVIDDMAQEASMSKPMIPAERVAGDLSALVCGDIPSRKGRSDRTAFAFRGLAVGDLAVAAYAYERARLIEM